MSEERARILQMISEGKISAEEGAKLLNALRGSAAAEPSPTKTGRWFRIRVIDLETDRIKVNVNLPLSLIRLATKMGARFAPDTDDFDWSELMAEIEQGTVGKLIEVEDERDRERVEIYVD